MARVVRVRPLSSDRVDGGTMVIQIGRVRLEVRAGVDESTLATVMRVLEAHDRTAEAQS